MNENDELLKQLMQESLTPANHTTDFDTNLELDVDVDEYGDAIAVNDAYSTQNKKQSLVGANGSVIDYKDVSPMEVIKKFAEQQKITLKDPRPNCKHCYGRGWIGRLQNGAPVACNCIYPPEIRKQGENYRFENRELRRNKHYKKQKALQEIKMLNDQLKAELALEKEFQIKAGLRTADPVEPETTE